MCILFLSEGRCPLIRATAYIGHPDKAAYLSMLLVCCTRFYCDTAYVNSLLPSSLGCLHGLEVFPMTLACLMVNIGVAACWEEVITVSGICTDTCPSMLRWFSLL